jgi:hypothetical protein
MILLPPWLTASPGGLPPLPDSSDFQLWIDPRDLTAGFTDGELLTTGDVLNKVTAVALAIGTVGTGGTAPKYRSAGPAIEYTASYNVHSSIIESDAVLGTYSDNLTVFLVLDVNMPAPGSGEINALLDLSAGGVETQSRIQINLADPTDPTYGGLYVRRGLGGGLVHTLAIPSSGMALITVEINAGAVAIRVNGVEVETGTFIFGANSNTKVWLGSQGIAPNLYGASRNFYQVIASTFLGSTLRDEWEAYLMAVFEI